MLTFDDATERVKVDGDDFVLFREAESGQLDLVLDFHNDRSVTLFTFARDFGLCASAEGAEKRVRRISKRNPWIVGSPFAASRSEMILASEVLADILSGIVGLANVVSALGQSAHIRLQRTPRGGVLLPIDDLGRPRIRPTA